MKQNKMQRAILKFKIDQSSVDELGTFTGYASRFGIDDSYGDVVDFGAFKRTIDLNNGRFKLFWSHQGGDPAIGYVIVEENKKGLRVKEGKLHLEIEKARDVYVNLKNDTLDGLSIGYVALQETIDSETKKRHLKEISLWEVSLCNYQACPGATVDEVKADDYLELKPYPNNHACLIDESLEVVGSMKRKHEGKEYTIRIGKDEDGKTGEHSYLYPKDTWTAEEAEAHCKSHDGTFEPATGKCQTCGADLDALSEMDPAKATPVIGDSQNKGDPAIGHSFLTYAEVIEKFRESNFTEE